jgi:hypothetical protein
VNVVGGNEIYNFRIHHLVHFYSRISSFWCSNRDSANKLVSAALCTLAPRPSAFVLVRCPMLVAVRGRASPEDARASRRVVVRARVTRPRAPLGPAVRLRPPALVRRTTAGTSRRRHRWSGRPLFKCSPFLLTSPDLAPAAPPRRRGRHLASHRLASPLGQREHE